MSLYPDQVKAKEDFEEWLDGGSLTCGLWAGAGMGKSHMVKHLIDEVLSVSPYKVVLTSMTHAAVEVLSNLTGLDVSTLHSTMGWFPKTDKNTGEETLSTPEMRGKDPRLSRNMLVIVDEAGLMGHLECRLLIEEAKKAGARLLFIGDNKQCFPVFKEGDKVCIPAYDSTEVYLQLTIPKRQNKGDVVYALAQRYRATVDGARQPKLQTMMNSDSSGKGVVVVDDIEDAAFEAFDWAQKTDCIKKVKVLAFTNKRCLTLNRKIRKKVLGLSDPTPTIGEEMVANTSITDATGENELIRNNERLIVESVEPTESNGMRGAFIGFVGVGEQVFVPESPTKLAERLKQLASEAKLAKRQGKSNVASSKWRSLFSLKDACADIRFTYAMTVNKCQGSTLKQVLIDMYDIDSCRDTEQKARLAYTAVSRATDKVIIEGELSH